MKYQKHILKTKKFFKKFILLLTTYYLLLTTPVYAVTTDIRTGAEAEFAIKDVGVLLKNVLGVAVIAAVILALAYLIWGA
ncbi:unnamed protein product, partial [marine sediment metagenome]